MTINNIMLFNGIIEMLKKRYISAYHLPPKDTNACDCIHSWRINLIYCFSSIFFFLSNKIKRPIRNYLLILIYWSIVEWIYTEDLTRQEFRIILTGKLTTLCFVNNRWLYVNAVVLCNTVGNIHILDSECGVVFINFTMDFEDFSAKCSAK